MHMCFCVLLYFTACMLYYCNTVGWAWWDSGLIWWLTILLQCFDAVGWVTWPVKISSPNDLYCVEWDVKPYSTQLLNSTCAWEVTFSYLDTVIVLLIYWPLTLSVNVQEVSSTCKMQSTKHRETETRNRSQALHIKITKRVEHKSGLAIDYFTLPTCSRHNCQRCELNWRQDETVLSCLESLNAAWTEFCLVPTQFPICNCSVSKIYWGLLLETLLSCSLFSSHLRQSQDNTALSVSKVHAN